MPTIHMKKSIMIQCMLMNLEIPLPPLEEQKRIVEKLEKIFKIIEEFDIGVSLLDNNLSKLLINKK